MVTSPYEWKNLEWDDKLQTNKFQPNIDLCIYMYLLYFHIKAESSCLILYHFKLIFFVFDVQYPELQVILKWSWFEYGFHVKFKVFDDMKYFWWLCEVWKKRKLTLQSPYLIYKNIFIQDNKMTLKLTDLLRVSKGKQLE